MRQHNKVLYCVVIIIIICSYSTCVKADASDDFKQALGGVYTSTYLGGYTQLSADRLYGCNEQLKKLSGALYQFISAFSGSTEVSQVINYKVDVNEEQSDVINILMNLLRVQSYFPLVNNHPSANGSPAGDESFKVYCSSSIAQVLRSLNRNEALRKPFITSILNHNYKDRTPDYMDDGDEIPVYTYDQTMGDAEDNDDELDPVNILPQTVVQIITVGYQQSVDLLIEKLTNPQLKALTTKRKYDDAMPSPPIPLYAALHNFQYIAHWLLKYSNNAIAMEDFDVYGFGVALGEIADIVTGDLQSRGFDNEYTKLEDLKKYAKELLNEYFTHPDVRNPSVILRDIGIVPVEQHGRTILKVKKRATNK